MGKLFIRRAEEKDVGEILSVYEAAKKFMRKSGNMNQWVNGYPDGTDVRNDMEKDQCYVITDGSEVVGVFAMIYGEDPTYSYIEDGQWLNGEPYVTVHRIASNGKYHGLMKLCLDFALERTDNVRIDTHADNKPMQHVLSKLGFERCGIIYIESGDKRTAFQFSRN